MTFAEIEQSARVGDLVFFSGQRLFSYFIRFWSRSEWSHVGIVVREADSDLDIGVQVVESLEGHGVQCVPLRVWFQNRGRLALGRVSLSGDLRLAMARQASFRRGCRYASPWQFVRSFSVFWSRLHRAFGLSDDRDPERYFCSELVAEAAFAVGVSLPKTPARMYPGDVADLPCVRLSPSIKVP